MELVKEAKENEVPMWSKSVDFFFFFFLHQFILNTKEYAEFCQTYFGNFLHHTPSLNEVGDWEDDLALRQHYLTVMVSSGYNPFFMQQKNLSNSVVDILPPIFAADQVLWRWILSKKGWTTEQINTLSSLIKPPTQEEKLKHFEGMTSEDIVEDLLNRVDPDLRCVYSSAIAQIIYHGAA